MSVVHIHFEPDERAADGASLMRLMAANAAYEAGEHVKAEEHVTFLSIEALLGALTPKRIALLQHLRSSGGSPSVRALADNLRRNYKNVHDDVAALLPLGLVVRAGNSVRAPHSGIKFDLVLDQVKTVEHA